MANNNCTLRVEVVLTSGDGTIKVTKGDIEGNILINVRNIDKDTCTICITKDELNNIVKLVNKEL